MQRFTQIVCFGLLLLPMMACQATDNEPFQAGVHYEVLPQAVPTVDPGRVEVAEVFWYGCSHCYDFEPKIEGWLESLPAYAVFTRVPAIWHKDMTLHARAYYTARAMDVLDKVHIKIFEAMNLKKQRLATETEIAELFAGEGVDKASFSKTFNSFGVNQSVRVGESRQRGYRTKGTPELVVNGKFRISTKHVGSQEKMLEVATYLVEKEGKGLQ